MKYLYYPGCSLKSTGKPYEESLKAVFSAPRRPLEELPRLELLRRHGLYGGRRGEVLRPVRTEPGPRGDAG